MLFLLISTINRSKSSFLSSLTQVPLSCTFPLLLFCPPLFFVTTTTSPFLLPLLSALQAHSPAFFHRPLQPVPFTQTWDVTAYMIAKRSHMPKNLSLQCSSWGRKKSQQVLVHLLKLNEEYGDHVLLGRRF